MLLKPHIKSVTIVKFLGCQRTGRNQIVFVATLDDTNVSHGWLSSVQAKPYVFNWLVLLFLFPHDKFTNSDAIGGQ